MNDQLSLPPVAQLPATFIHHSARYMPFRLDQAGLFIA